MKARSIIDAPEDTPFQIDEHESTPNLADVDVEDDAAIVQEEENDTDDNVDEEVDAIDDGYGDAWRGRVLDEDDDNFDEDDDDDFTESMFM